LLNSFSQLHVSQLHIVLTGSRNYENAKHHHEKFCQMREEEDIQKYYNKTDAGQLLYFFVSSDGHVDR
jgi:hypothetical protein